MYDLLIENACICDGMGAPSFHDCVAVKNGIIVAVGNHQGGLPGQVLRNYDA